MAVVIKVGETEAVSVDIGEKVYIQGDPGFSPTIEVTDITGGHRLTITDINGDKTVDVMNGAKGDKGATGDTGATGNGIEYITLNADYTLTVHYTNGTEWTSASIRGEKGDKGDTGATGPTGQPGQTGATPDISIGTVTTGAAGSQAKATMTGTPEQPVLNLTIPRGDPGEVTQAEFDDLADEVADQKSAIDDLTDLVDRKAGMLVDSVSGDIASFVPDATVPNLLGVSVDIEPVQDLHGYDAPWPAGGGANIYNGEYESGYYDVTTGNAGASSNWARNKTPVPCTASTSYRFISKATTSQGSIGYILLYDADGNYLNSYIQMNSAVYQGGQVFSTPANCQQMKFYMNPAWFENTQLCIELSSVTGFHPYSNLCPISGWDSVELERTGANLFDINGGTSFIYDGVAIQNNKIVISSIGSGATSRVYFAKTYKPGTYTFSTKMSGQLEYDRFFSPQPFAGGTYNSYYGGYFAQLINGQITVTMTEPFTIGVIGYGTAGGQGEIYDIQLEPGSTASAYHPYAGNRYTIQLGQTVYGGTLDVTAGTLTVDRVAVDMGDIDWIRQSNGSIAWFAKNMSVMADPIKPSTSALNYAQVQYSAYTYNGFGYTASLQDCKSISNGVVLYVRDDSCATAADFIAKNAGQRLVYELATPITITLDPVTIATIAGQTNNVWADAGDVSVSFAADLKAYIDSKIAAAVAALS